MKKIEEVDKNFAHAKPQFEGMKVFDILEEPFKIYGLYNPHEGEFRRMPASVAEKVNDGVNALHTHTSGGRIRFKTDSSRIILKCILPNLIRFSHMPLTGSSCFDLYADGEYGGVFQAGLNLDENYESEISFPQKKLRDIVINFPLYNDVSKVFIALEEDAVVMKGEEYKNKQPVVFYGSSITQGGCASHPGNAYANIISRKLNLDFVNLGFSGSCHGENVMAQYVSEMEMCAFVYDYDHNAQTLTELEENHESFFKILREKQPKLPIVIVTAADNHFGQNVEKRKEIIRRTYLNAVAEGDENVYFLDGQTIYADVGLSLCTVDKVHPNDLGFWCMAEKIGSILEKI